MYWMSYLSDSYKDGEYNGSQTDPKHTVDQEATKKTEDDIGPGVEGIECHEVPCAHIHVILNAVLQSCGVVIAEVASWKTEIYYN